MISEKKKEYWVARHLTGDAGDDEIEKFLEVHGDLLERPRWNSSPSA